MSSRDELEDFKKVLRENIANLDAERFLKNVEKFHERFEDILEADDYLDLKNLLANMKKTERPMATYHEFVLFLVVMAFLISIFAFFGYKLYKSLTDRERKREEKLRAKSAKKKK